MALVYRAFYTNCLNIHNITKPVRWSIEKSLRVSTKTFTSRSNYKPVNFTKICLLPQKNSILCTQFRHLTVEPPQKVGLVQRFKEMYKKYWYVVLPVHMITSGLWLSGFYYIVRSEVNVLEYLESFGVPEELLVKIRESKAGYFALTFALYKLATPLRYAVTLGATTYAIKRLTSLGWIKPVPSKERLKEMMNEQKVNLQGRIQESKAHFQESKAHYQSQVKEKSSRIMEEMRRYKLEMRNTKNKK